MQLSGVSFHYFLSTGNGPVIQITREAVGNDGRLLVRRACSSSAQGGAGGSAPHLCPVSRWDYRLRTSNASAPSSAYRVLLLWNLSGRSSTEEKTGPSLCSTNAPTPHARFPSAPFGTASCFLRKLFLPTPTLFSKGTGGSSAGVSISGCATPAVLNSRCVSTRTLGCGPSRSATGQLRTFSLAPLPTPVDGQEGL